ncbi:MAG TPA: short-chain dehydrogenase, partial [Alcanivorax sp.]|nr:short-chain dehydrogenase [Alcanivorax sp.]
MSGAKRKTLRPSEGAAALVTGAGSGIGRSFAYEIVRRG